MLPTLMSWGDRERAHEGREREHKDRKRECEDRERECVCVLIIVRILQEGGVDLPTDVLGGN